MNNKKTGNRFETEFAEILSAAGHWVYVMPTKFGQPADIVSGKDGKITLYDCKDCKNGDFVLSRVEANQHDSAELFDKCGCNQYYFAIRSFGKVYCVPYKLIKEAIAMEYKVLKTPLLEFMSKAVYDANFE